jgi:zinc transport system permease protein
MEFFQYDFMQRALLAGLITALICPLVGMFVVVRRQALIGDGLGHIAFAGVTGGYLLGVYPTAAAALLTMAGAAAIDYVRRRHAQHADTALAIFFYSGIALAVIFSSMARVPGNGLLGVLFGSILTVSAADLWLIFGCAGIVLAAIYLLYEKLVLLALDEDIAAVAGINTRTVSVIFSMLTALVVVVGMRVVGILLVSALMVIPVAAAHLMRRGFKQTLIWAVLFSLFAVLGGTIAAFYLDIAPGGTIVMTAVLIYVLVLFGFDRDLSAKLNKTKCAASTIVARNQKSDQ